MRKIIIGLGTGRCGTTTLTHLFNIQDNCSCTHEHYTRDKFGLRWKEDLHILSICLVDMLLRPEPIVSDVGFYWLNYAPHVLSYHRDAKFICLKRSREDTIDSFKRYPPTPDFLTNQFGDNGWSFPRYNTNGIDGLYRYYDEYYLTALNFEHLYPQNFKIFPIEYLNTNFGQYQILDFAGFKNYNYCVGTRLNTSDQIADAKLKRTTNKITLERTPPHGT